MTWYEHDGEEDLQRDNSLQPKEMWGQKIPLATHLDHDESSFAESRALHGECGRGPGICTGKVILVVSHLGSNLFRSESLLYEIRVEGILFDMLRPR